jgi:stage II sporulation protein D
VRQARILLVAAIVAAFVIGSGAMPARADDGPHDPIQTIELRTIGDSRIIVDGRPYRGPINLSLYEDGIAVTETTSIEGYLEGIAEMPFDWHPEALKAQAVAARTYLARRLLPGRRGDEAAHGYDICATNRCQVYRGLQLIERDGGVYWRDAVEETRGEVLIYGDRPIEAVFTSMVGSRSRSNQDVWASTPIPYLQAVDSPEEGVAKFFEWTVEVSPEQFVAIVRADGLNVGGDLIGITVDDPPEGEGRTTITIRTQRGTDSILAPNLKGAFNRQGDELFPGVLPARLTDGSMLPEPLLSYTYDITFEPPDPHDVPDRFPSGDQPDDGRVVINGEGWGHGVGMSQWGARIMADNGSTYSDILSHYYSGLEPERVPEFVPETVVVGLDTALDDVDFEIEGLTNVSIDGRYRGIALGGAWSASIAGDTIVLVSGNPFNTVLPVQVRRGLR